MSQRVDIIGEIWKGPLRMFQVTSKRLYEIWLRSPTSIPMFVEHNTDARPIGLIRKLFMQGEMLCCKGIVYDKRDIEDKQYLSIAFEGFSPVIQEISVVTAPAQEVSKFIITPTMSGRSDDEIRKLCLAITRQVQSCDSVASGADEMIKVLNGLMVHGHNASVFDLLKKKPDKLEEPPSKRQALDAALRHFNDIGQ